MMTPTYEPTTWRSAAATARPTPTVARTGRRENRTANTPKSPPTTRRNAVVIEKTDETCNAESPKVAASRSAYTVKVKTVPQIVVRMQMPSPTISHPCAESRASSRASATSVAVTARPSWGRTGASYVYCIRSSFRRVVRSC
jgi:hypothetical protein